MLPTVDQRTQTTHALVFEMLEVRVWSTDAQRAAALRERRSSELVDLRHQC